MLTPVFDLCQDDNFLIVKIKAPFAKVSDTEILIEDKEILFFSKPYYLRLYFPFELTENGREKADYDSDQGSFTIFAPKKIPGQYIDNLNLISRFLSPQGNQSAAPILEEVSEENSGEGTDLRCDETVKFVGSDGEIRWFWEQKLPDFCLSESIKLEKDMKGDSFGYGFASRRKGVFEKLKEEIWELVELHNPDVLSVNDRRRQSYKLELEKFDGEYYLADTFTPPEDLNTWLNLEAPWSSAERTSSLTDDEVSRLKEFPRRRYEDLTEAEIQSALLSLIDVIFAYAYDFRITEGEHCVESGWTISKLSPTLSCLVSWQYPKQAVEACFRRAVSYPLCRNWGLAEKIFSDVIGIFEKGNVCLLKCLLDIHKIFSTSGEYRYILNDLYITDYCIWIQLLDQKTLRSFTALLSDVKLCKENTGLNLTELELVGGIESLNVVDECGENERTETVSSNLDFLSQVRKNCNFEDDTRLVDSDDD